MKKDHRTSLRQIIAGDTMASQRPDEMMLAAWLEGRLTDPETEQVEAWLCHDPALREALTREAVNPQPLPPRELAYDTLFPPPAPASLRVAYDTLSGVAVLSWSPPRVSEIGRAHV